ncbi:BQ5605_C003g01850 [Microbotryum silenes-dioicae]|uniref:BQ5605_C003g01850 protein n=1 Tax=Microbotryum silenes-dioicae TaxID=796604 RepID=A0A2X0P2N3_9BASI|nr:BQ5605_C003g01850 [Microbotryum silenes-dioicae]
MSSTTTAQESRSAPAHFEEMLDHHFECQWPSPDSGRSSALSDALDANLMLFGSIKDTYDNGYEFWVPNHERIIYAIHGGPMAGRLNYQTASVGALRWTMKQSYSDAYPSYYPSSYYQRIRKDMWQVSWVEETGTTVTICLDFSICHIVVILLIEIALSFRSSHWDYPEKAHGYKREKLDQWRELSKIGNQTTDRHILPEQATINKIYKGKGSLQEIEMEWPTL